MLNEKQQHLISHYLLRDKYLIPRLNEFGLKLFRVNRFSWLRTTDLADFSRDCTFELYDIREPSTEATQVIKTCVVVSSEEDILVYRFAEGNQELAIHKPDFEHYLVKILK